MSISRPQRSKRPLPSADSYDVEVVTDIHEATSGLRQDSAVREGPHLASFVPLFPPSPTNKGPVSIRGNE